MPKHTQKEIVRAILTNGRPYKRGITSEGSAESGPISYWFFGFRWGRTEVEVTQSGTLFLQINIKKQGMAGVYRLWGSPVLSREITPENQWKKDLAAQMYVALHDVFRKNKSPEEAAELHITIP